MQIPTAPTVCPAEYNDIHHRWVRPQPLMISEIPWPVERHSYLPDPSFPLAHAFTRARIFCEGSGHQTRQAYTTSFW